MQKYPILGEINVLKTTKTPCLKFLIRFNTNPHRKMFAFFTTCTILSNCHYDDLRKAANQAWQTTCLDSEKIKSICRAKYIENAFI